MSRFTLDLIWLEEGTDKKLVYLRFEAAPARRVVHSTGRNRPGIAILFSAMPMTPSPRLERRHAAVARRFDILTCAKLLRRGCTMMLG